MALFTLPYITLQPSTSQVFADVGNESSEVAVEDVWCSFYRPMEGENGEPGGSLHGRIRVSETDEPGQVEIHVREGELQVEQVFEVSILAARALFLCPSTCLTSY
jgi:hypothetical protein